MATLNNTLLATAKGVLKIKKVARDVRATCNKDGKLLSVTSATTTRLSFPHQPKYD
jgi:hypothetical protein